MKKENPENKTNSNHWKKLKSFSAMPLICAANMFAGTNLLRSGGGYAWAGTIIIIATFLLAILSMIHNQKIIAQLKNAQ